MPDLKLPDITLHYEVDGDGPPLILIAGMVSDSATWLPVVAALSEHFTVIRPDNRSTGRTVPWDAPASVQTYAQDAAELMAHLGFDHYHVAGHSMGGLIGMELAGAHPEQVQSLAVLASAPVRAPKTMAVFDTLRDIRKEPNGEALWLRALYPWVFRPDFFTDPDAVPTALEAALAYPHAQSAAAMAHQIEVLREYRPTVRLPDIRTRTMVLHAEHDILVPRIAAEAAFAVLANVEQIIVPDAGHSVHWDAPDAVISHLTRFCTQSD